MTLLTSINKPIFWAHSKDTLYYDASCPLCSTEIKHLKNLQQGELYCADIQTELPEVLANQKEDMLGVLHLYKKSGHCLRGLDATVEAWSHTRYGRAFRFLRWPIVKFVADKVYFTWAKKRYERKYACGPCQL
jgi:predicted DCC family thiol-disulfide oxidoreductase YuxK